MREWLAVIITLLIAGILLDGLRRMRRARREGLRVSRSVRQFDDEGIPEPAKACGQPRVVSQRDHRDAETLTRSMRESFARSKVTVGAPRRVPEQTSLNLRESVPMLMDSVEDAQRREQEPRRDYTQAPSWAEPEAMDEDDSLADDGESGDSFSYSGDYSGDAVDSGDDSDDGDAYEYDSFTGEPEDDPDLGSTDGLEDEGVTSDRREPGSLATSETGDMSAVEATGETTSEPALEEDTTRWVEPEEVLVINLMAPAGRRFDGSELLEALLQQDLRFGAMNIFHRHKNADGSGPSYFSLANMVVPGTFDLSTMAEFSTPGVSMFLGLPHEDSIAAFDCMATTAKALAEQLGGELKDENRSVMTRQTIEHCRQRVLEFERKQRLMQH